MSLTILAQRRSTKTCEKHGCELTELLLRGTELQSDWVIAICVECQEERDWPLLESPPKDTETKA